MKTSPIVIAKAVGATVGISVLALIAFCPRGQKADAIRMASDQQSSNPKPTAFHSSADSAAGPTTTSLEAALQAILLETDPAHRQSLLEQWANAIDVNDLENTLEQLESISNLKLKFEVRAALLTSWDKRDLAGAVTWFGERNRPDSLQEQARDLFAQAMAGRDPIGMLSWMEKSVPDATRNELYGPFFRQWAKTDPAAAATMLSQLANPQAGNPEATAHWNDLLGQVAAQWANSNLNQAVGWVQSLPNSAGKSQALLQLSSRWTEVSPLAAAAYAATRGDIALIGAVAGKWAASDPASAASWASQLPPGDGRDGAITSLATIWAENDVTAAATYVSSLPPGTAQNRATAAVVSMWASDQPNQAAQWVGQFPEGPAREQAVEALMGSWSGENAGDAAQWLQTLPKTHSRDVAISAYSRAIYASNPGNAFQWGANISDDSLRHQQMVSVARYWLQKDPSVAREQINFSSLPQNLKADLLANSARSDR